MSIFSRLFETKEAREKRMAAERLAIVKALQKAREEEAEAKRLAEAEVKRLAEAEAKRRPEALEEAIRKKTFVRIECEQCGQECRAFAEPVAPNTSFAMTQAQAMILSRYCETCNIAVCGRCTGVSEQGDVYLMTSYRCPRCGKGTVWAAACHLRTTRTRVL